MNYLLAFIGSVFAALLLAAVEGLIGVGVARLIENNRQGFLMLAGINFVVLLTWATRKRPEFGNPMTRFLGATVLPCILERGGFSSEVTFRIDIGEATPHVGCCHRDHTLNDDKQPFESDDLPAGALINGYIKCRKLRTEGRVALVEVPSGETIYVQCDELEQA